MISVFDFSGQVLLSGGAKKRIILVNPSFVCLLSLGMSIWSGTDRDHRPNDPGDTNT